MATKKRQSSAASRRPASRVASGKRASSKNRYVAIVVVGVVVLAGIVGAYAFKQPADALAMGCSSGYSAPIVPQDTNWNADASLVITQNLSEPTYDRATRSCSWQETLTVANQQGVERKSCDIHADGQRIACPEAGQTVTVFSGIRTGDPNRTPYLPSEFYVEEVLGDGAVYHTPTFNY